MNDIILIVTANNEAYSLQNLNVCREEFFKNVVQVVSLLIGHNVF